MITFLFALGVVVILLLLAQVNVWLKTTWLFRPRRPRPYGEEQLEAELHRRLLLLSWVEWHRPPSEPPDSYDELSRWWWHKGCRPGPVCPRCSSF